MSIVIRSILLGVFLLIVNAAPAGVDQKAYREILAHQDLRSLGSGRLVSYLHHEDLNVVVMAARALANIQDTSAVAPLLGILHHRSPQVREMAVFALGQIGDSSSQAPLIALLQKEEHSAVERRLLEALGKLGDAHALHSVIAFRASEKHPATIREQMLALARFALRGVTSSRAAALAMGRAFHENSEVRWSALHALWRMCPHRSVDSLVDRRSADLEKLARDRTIEPRAQLATLLGKSASKAAFRMLQEMGRRELPGGNWRVGVQVVRSALVWLRREVSAGEILERGLRSESDHVRMAVLTGLVAAGEDAAGRARTRRPLLSEIERIAAGASARSPVMRGEATVVLARLKPSTMRISASEVRALENIVLRTKYLEAMSYLPSLDHIQQLVRDLEHDNPRIAATAWEVVPRMLTPAAYDQIRDTTGFLDSLPAILFRRLKRALLREDLAITATVASCTRDSSFSTLLQGAGLRDELIETLMLAFTQLSSPNDVEAMQEMIRTLAEVGDERAVPVLERALEDDDQTVCREARLALERLTGRTVEVKPRRGARVSIGSFDWKTLDGIGGKTRVRIYTSRGSFTVVLLKEHAPFTVAAFVKLVRAGFYDGLSFHRIVPNFVVQGGDPRGDGWGGPGYAIRTEISTVNYRRGSVGMASAGKDTEGCQFFVTHSPQPHLDGRYTIFGEVESGMEVVDSVQPEDRILRVRLIK